MSNKIFYKCFFLLFFLLFKDIQSSNINEISLDKSETSKEETFTDIESELFHINGLLSENKKYLLITATNEIKNNELYISKSPLLFISKYENSTSYEYTSISQSKDFGNKIALPYSYLTDDADGFQLNVTCEKTCEKLDLKLEAKDEIELEIGEKFSFLSKNDENIKININLKKYIFGDEVEKVAFVINGGEPRQLSMWMNGVKAKKVFKDVYLVSMSLNEIKTMQNEDEKIQIEIKVGKNVKFNFNTLLINNDEYTENNNKKIYEGEYNQYLAIKGNRIECFDVQINGEDKSESLEIPRGITILGHNDFQVNINCDIKGETNKVYFEREDEIDDYVVSEGLNCKSTVKEICIKSSSEDLDIIQIHIHRRETEDNNSKKIRKMDEPLLNDITYIYTLEEENSEVNNNNHINLHTHSQFYEKNENKKDIIGINFGIEVLYGIIKVYKDVCETFPYCSMTKEKLKNLIKGETKDSTFETLSGEGGYYSSSILSIDDTYSMSNKQNIIIVLCEDNNFDGCSYEITYYSIESYKTLFSGGLISKFLPFYDINSLYPKKDKYQLFLHKNKKIVLDLIVYSGDAYITPITQKDGCIFEEHHLGSNERRIITCSNNDNEELDRILFDVRANNNAAFYSIYALEKDVNDLEDAWPMEMTIMESIHESERSVKVLGKYLNDPPRKATSNFVTIFNSLNCDLNVYNLNTSRDHSSEDNYDIVQDVTKAAKRMDIFYEIKKQSDFHTENKNCLYFISSFDMKNEDSSFIIPEAKPFRFKLDWETNILRVNFPYAINDDEKNKNVFLRINLLNNIPIKITIRPGYLPAEEYILYYSKNINIISNKSNLRKNNFIKIKITIETIDKYDEAIIDLSIRTNSPIPYSIKTEKYFSDLALSNNIQYYMTLIKQNSEGEILVNFKRNQGKICAKLVREDKLREVSGWGDRFIVPNNKIDQRLLLPFDPYTQKVTFSKNETNNCDKYCYLLFGIDANDNDNINSEENDEDYFIPYNLYLKYSDENEKDIKYIDLQNNEYITNYLHLNKSDYYQYHIYDFFGNENLTKVVIDLYSDNCELIIGFNTDNFSDPTHTKILVDKNSSSTKFEISKEEILNIYYSENNIDEYSIADDLFLYYKISQKPNLNNLLNLNELDLLYTLRTNTPNTFAEKLNILNNVQPNNCHFTKDKKYCDYLMKLESINPQTEIEIFALTDDLKKIYIYANVMSADKFGEYANNYTLPQWPEVQTEYFDFPENLQKTENYLSLNYSQLASKLDNLIDPLLLIRVYGEPDTDAKIMTSIHSNNKNNVNVVTPTINRNQIYSVKRAKTLYINLPNDDDFMCKLIPMKGKGKITYHDRKYILEGNYEPLTFNSVKNGDNKLKIESMDTSPNKASDDFPFKFSLIFSKMKKFGTNEAVLGSNNFAYENIQLPMNYYTDITNVDNDISFDVFLEDFGYIYNDNEANQNSNLKLKNYTEDFTIKGYLLTEDKLNDVINHNREINDNDNYAFGGSFDLTHHAGNIHIPKEKIKDFKKKNANKKLYLYTTINKAYNNRNNYSFIKGKINLILPENPMNQIPYDTYILGYIKGNENQANKNETVNHKYKLNLASINDDNSYLKLEFTSINKDTQIKLVDSKNNKINGLIQKIYQNMDKYGKDIYIIKPEKLTEDLFLSVDSPVEKYDNEYTFKYSLLNNDKYKEISNNYLYEYDPKMTECNVSDNSNLYIKFKKIKLNNNKKANYCNCDYYINVYKDNKNIKNNKNINKNTISIKKSELPYAIYKINGENSDVEDIKANIRIYGNDKDNIYYEVIAEDKDSKEMFGYERNYLNEKSDTDDSKDGNRKGEFDWALLILIIILSLIIFIITICICKHYCCNSKSKTVKKKKKKKEDLTIDINNDDLVINEDDDSDKIKY